MNTWVIEKETQVNAPLEKVFDFFSKAENLEKLTPAFLNFEILTPLPVNMNVGTEIEYKIKLYGIPVRWTTLIESWGPPHFFVDVQLKGPYTMWRHTHTFKETDEITVIGDHVEYRPKGWLLARLINDIFVRKDIEKIFNYREQIIQTLF